MQRTEVGVDDEYGIHPDHPPFLWLLIGLERLRGVEPWASPVPGARSTDAELRRRGVPRVGLEPTDPGFEPGASADWATEVYRAGGGGLEPPHPRSKLGGLPLAEPAPRGATGGIRTRFSWLRTRGPTHGRIGRDAPPPDRTENLKDFNRALCLSPSLKGTYVDLDGIEPSTSGVLHRRAPYCATTPQRPRPASRTRCLTLPKRAGLPSPPPRITSEAARVDQGGCPGSVGRRPMGRAPALSAIHCGVFNDQHHRHAGVKAQAAGVEPASSGLGDQRSSG